MTEVEPHSNNNIWKDKVAQVVERFLDGWEPEAFEDYAFQRELEYYVNPKNRDDLLELIDILELDIEI